MKQNNKIIEYANGPSLEEINSTIEVKQNSSFLKNLLKFSGPGALVAVGYMDPGNWVTSIAGGAQYKYLLLSIVLISSLIAMLLQYMAAKLGIVTRMDLAQAIREHTSKKISFIFWICTELAIMATDIAEIIGSAIALNLLFKIPILIAVLITIFDVIILLLLMRLGFRKIEAIVISLILIIILVFSYEVALSNPNWKEVIIGFVPNYKIASNKSILFLALGIVGATVMPHNLFLHSAISQTRKIKSDRKSIENAIRFSTWDSNIQLFIAFIANCLLLILGASLFYGNATHLGTLGDLFNALEDPKIVGAIASPLLSILFAVALLASGQNSTITGTLTGQVIMEGFVKLKLPAWARRLVTRLISVIPVIICVLIFGDNEQSIENLLTYSQVFLSIALPISIIPLTLLTSSKSIMGEFKNSKLISFLAWICTIILTILNFWLIISTIFNI